jgi:hypothetical protein
MGEVGRGPAVRRIEKEETVNPYADAVSRILSEKMPSCVTIADVLRVIQLGPRATLRDLLGDQGMEAIREAITISFGPRRPTTYGSISDAIAAMVADGHNAISPAVMTVLPGIYTAGVSAKKNTSKRKGKRKR